MALYSYPAVGHLAGDILDFQAIWNATPTNRRQLVTSNTELIATLANGGAIARLNNDEIDVIAIADGVYNFSAYNMTITAARTDANPAYIGPLNKGGVIIGVNASSDNPGNQWRFSGASYVTWGGFLCRYAYRSTTNIPFVYIADNCSFVRITGNTLIRCGYAGSIGAIEIGGETCHDIRVDHNVFREYTTAASIVPLRFDGWPGELKITSITRSGSTATVVYNAFDQLPLANGDHVMIHGVNPPEYQTEDAVISGIGGAGQSRFFQYTVSGSPATPALFDNELNQGMVKNITWANHYNCVVNYNTWMDSPSLQGDAANMQMLPGRVGLNQTELPNNTISHNVYVNVGSNTQYCNEKGGGTISRYNLLLAPVAVNLRNGNNKQLEGIVAPFSGVEVVYSGHTIKHCVFKELYLKDGGAFDGVTPSGVRDTLFGDTNGVTVEHVTLLNGAYGFGVGKQDGYNGLVSDNPSQRVTFRDSIIKLSNAPAFSAFNHDLATIMTTQEIEYTSGGTYTLQEGDTITGASSGETATVVHIQQIGGTYAGGDAYGLIAVQSASGAFDDDENFNVGGNSNVFTMVGNATPYVIDGINYDLSGTATQAYVSDNDASEASNFNVRFRPTATSPFLDTAVGTYTDEFDPEGRAVPSTGGWRGAFGYTAPSYLVEDTFGDSAGTAVTASGRTLTTNESGSVWQTPTTTFLQDGSGNAYATSAGCSNIINLSNTEQRPSIRYVTGGANTVMLLVRTNATLTTGYAFEVGDGNLVKYYKLPDLTNPILTLQNIPLSGATTHHLFAVATGDSVVPYIDDLPLPGVTDATVLGTYVGFYQGLWANVNLRIAEFRAETDETVVVEPSEPVEFFRDSFTGSTMFINNASYTVDAGTGYAAFSSGGSGNPNSFRRASGYATFYVTLDDSHAALKTVPAPTEVAVSLKLKIASKDSTSAHTFGMFQRAEDSSNFYACKWRKNLMDIWSVVAGTKTQRTSVAVSPEIGVGDEIEMYVDNDGDGHPVITVYRTISGGSRTAITTWTDTSDNFTVPGDVGLFGGNLLVSGDDLYANWGVDDVVGTEYPAISIQDPTAPTFITTPSVTGAGNDIVTFSAQCDIEAKHYVILWASPSIIGVDSTGVADVIAGNDPDDNALTTKASDLDTTAGETVNLSVSGLSASPKWKWAYTATAESDDTEMLAPVVGEVFLAAPTDKSRTIITNGTGILTSSPVYTAYGIPVDGSIVEYDTVTANGNAVVVDASGNVQVAASSTADSYTINLWDIVGWAYLGEVVVNIAGQEPTWTIDRVMSSGTPVDGVDVRWTYWPNGTVGNLAGITPIEGLGTFNGGVLSGEVLVAGNGHLLVTDSATGARYWTGQVTAA